MKYFDGSFLNQSLMFKIEIEYEIMSAHDFSLIIEKLREQKVDGKYYIVKNPNAKEITIYCTEQEDSDDEDAKASKSGSAEESSSGSEESSSGSEDSSSGEDSSSSEDSSSEED